jgi:hypothetical protein
MCRIVHEQTTMAAVNSETQCKSLTWQIAMTLFGMLIIITNQTELVHQCILWSYNA